MSTESTTPESPATISPEPPTAELVDPSMVDANTWTDVVVAVSGIVTALATVGLVVGAFWAGRIAVQTLRQMKADSIAQTRPYVHASLVPSMGGHAWDLVIRNTGRSSARQLVLTAGWWPEKEDAVVRDLKRLFSTPRTMPPDARIRTYWNLDPTNVNDGQTAGVTKPVTVTVKYWGLEDEDPYTDTFELDHTAFGMTPLGWEGIDIEGQSGVEKRLQEVVRGLSELRRFEV